MDNILEVKNLKISFRTNGGNVKAVRDISFDLKRGETLAIVGESGSGKSVTSKAILGILAGNSIVEGGEILYDGKDLLKIDEEDMHKLRGDKISMIFQDPLSSLDPIVKIGKQITEAMLLKNKANRKASRKEFNIYLKLLKENMLEYYGTAEASKINQAIKTFDDLNVKAIKLENAYNEAHTRAEELIADINDMLFLIDKKQKFNVKDRLYDFAKKLALVKDRFLTPAYDSDIENYVQQIKSAARSYTPVKGEGVADRSEIKALLNKIDVPLHEIIKQTRPNFFRIGFYMLKTPDADFSGKSIDQINALTLNYLDDNFMKDFIELETNAVKNSFNKSLDAKKAVLAEMPAVRSYFAGNFEKKEATTQVKKISALVKASINRLETIKDSRAYTFESSLSNIVEKYFLAVKNNPKEEARYARQSAKRDALIAKGKKVDWKVTPKAVYDLDELRGNILKILDGLTAKYEKDIENVASVDFNREALVLIDYLKEKASQVVFKLTKRMAKEKAIKLMDEVGIPEARIRFNQYPFEFSGGMRQRIVIAIALSANPDILICDEPTTALDVTIQAQILELINNLKKERNLSVIFITHDLGVVANMADKIAVLYAGKIVEYGNVDDVFYDPRHPYTWALLSSMPDLDTNEKLEAIPGTPPNMIYPPVGDAFAARNKYALKIDFEEQPPAFEVSPTHWAATWLLHPDAPKVDPPAIVSERIARMKKLGGADNAE